MAGSAPLCLCPFPAVRFPLCPLLCISPVPPLFPTVAPLCILPCVHSPCVAPCAFPLHHPFPFCGPLLHRSLYRPVCIPPVLPLVHSLCGPSCASPLCIPPVPPLHRNLKEPYITNLCSSTVLLVMPRPKSWSCRYHHVSGAIHIPNGRIKLKSRPDHAKCQTDHGHAGITMSVERSTFRMAGSSSSPGLIMQMST